MKGHLLENGIQTDRQSSMLHNNNNNNNNPIIPKGSC